MKHIKKIKLDIDKKSLETVSSVQYDSNTRFLHISLVNNSLPLDLSGCSVKISAIKPDDTVIFNNCTIIDAKQGFIEVELTEQINAISGTVKCELKIYSETGVLTTKTFDIEVTASITASKTITSKNEFKALTDALKVVQGIDNKADEEKVEEKFGEVYEQLEKNKNIIGNVKESIDNFKENGGEIGGNISLLGLLKLNNNVYVKEDNKNLILGANNKDSVIANNTEFKPASSGINLGCEESKWKDLWLGDYSKESNGYTTLPNGLILQWGIANMKTKDGGCKVDATYPISFPNGALAQMTQVKNCENDYTATRMISIGRAWRSSITILVQQVSGTPVRDNADCTVGWIALGY